MKGPVAPPPGLLQELLSQPLYLVLLIVAVLLVAALVFFIIRRRRRKPPAGAAAPPPVKAKGPSLDLRRPWRAFVSSTPREYRPALRLFQPFVVLGGASAGKSSLIDRFTDWQGQAAQLLPSYLDDPRVQIYRGPSSFVMEISAELVEDPSPRVRDALLRLWRPLRNGREPRAVVVIDAGRLLMDAPDALVRHVQSIRGKLNLLSKTIGKPVKSTLVITRAERFEGFVELQRLLREYNIPLRMELPADDFPLQAWFDRFEDYLPFALSKGSPTQYLRMLGFFRDAPALVEKLGIVMRTLRAADPFSETPRIQDLAFVAAPDGGRDIWNPLGATIAAEEARKFRPLRKHQLIAAGSAALIVILLWRGYEAEKEDIRRASEVMADLFTHPGDAPARERFEASLEEARRSWMRRLLPSFLEDHETMVEEEIRRLFVEGMRRRVLIPFLAQCRPGEGPKTLYALALLHAQAGKMLGDHVFARAAEFEDQLMIPVELINDYVNAVEEPFTTPIPIDQQILLSCSGPVFPEERPDLARFLKRVKELTEKRFLNEDDLVRLKAEAIKVEPEAKALSAARRVILLGALLKQQTGEDLVENWRDSVGDAPDLDPDAVGEVVRSIVRTDPPGPAQDTLDFQTFVEELRKVLEEHNKRMGRELSFRVEGDFISFDPTRWNQLVARTKLDLLIRSFRADHEDGDVNAALFVGSRAFPDVTLNVARDAGRFVAGTPRVNGMFTRAAFDARIRPALDALPTLLKVLPIEEDEKNNLLDFVQTRIADYAGAYVTAWDNYVRALDFKLGNVAVLRTALLRLQTPSSPLKRMLSDVVLHTSYEVPEGNQLFEPLSAISDTFASLRDLMPAAGGPPGAIEEYMVLLKELEGGMEIGAPPAPPPPEKEGEVPVVTLDTRLTPIGRLALKIFRDEADSPRRKVEAWLLQTGLRQEWEKAFLQPFQAVYSLGVPDIESTIAKAWHELEQAHITPLSLLFPFKRTADSIATVSQIEAALLPKGAFWSDFTGQIGPIAVRNRLGWTRRTSRHGTLAIPDGMLEMASRMAVVSNRLWDAEGKPIPLKFNVRALPLPNEKSGEQRLVAGYLQVGKDTVFGFNQRPDWTPLPLEWDKVDTTTVGTMYSPHASERRTYRSVSVQDRMWSLYVLLRDLGTENQAYTWSWEVPGPEGQTVVVLFQFENDPWSMLRLDVPRTSQRAAR